MGMNKTTTEDTEPGAWAAMSRKDKAGFIRANHLGTIQESRDWSSPDVTWGYIPAGIRRDIISLIAPEPGK
jgi:hypothetical protein